jgi:hypothetical protein
VVGHRLEYELALDLEHIPDVVEDPGEVAVGQRPGVTDRAVVGLVIGRRIGILGERHRR